MRGFLHTSIRSVPSDSQAAFRALSRSRRTRLAKAASTTLLKADQWARGDGAGLEIAVALEKAVVSLKAKKK